MHPHYLPDHRLCVLPLPLVGEGRGEGDSFPPPLGEGEGGGQPDASHTTCLTILCVYSLSHLWERAGVRGGVQLFLFLIGQSMQNRVLDFTADQ